MRSATLTFLEIPQGPFVLGTSAMDSCPDANAFRSLQFSDANAKLGANRSCQLLRRPNWATRGALSTKHLAIFPSQEKKRQTGRVTAHGNRKTQTNATQRKGEKKKEQKNWANSWLARAKLVQMSNFWAAPRVESSVTSFGRCQFH